MKIIDFDRKGNTIRFYATEDDYCTDYCGDDWDDCPYEYNAGPVYDKYIDGWLDVYFPFDCNVLEPADSWHDKGSGYCKNDFKDSIAPCIVAINEEEHPIDDYKYAVARKDSVKIYFNDDVEEIAEICENFLGATTNIEFKDEV